MCNGLYSLLDGSDTGHTKGIGIELITLGLALTYGIHSVDRLVEGSSPTMDNQCERVVCAIATLQGLEFLLYRR